jgi:hypothetical protein
MFRSREELMSWLHREGIYFASPQDMLGGGEDAQDQSIRVSFIATFLRSISNCVLKFNLGKCIVSYFWILDPVTYRLCRNLKFKKHIFQSFLLRLYMLVSFEN